MPLEILPVKEAEAPEAAAVRELQGERVTMERLAKRIELMHGEIMEWLGSHDRRIRQLELRALATGLVGGGLASLLGQLSAWGSQ